MGGGSIKSGEEMRMSTRWMMVGGRREKEKQRGGEG